MLGCDLTLKQSPTNGLLVLKRDYPVTQLLAPTVALELALTCPCPQPGHRAKRELKTTPRTQRIIFFGSLLPDWSFPKCFVFTADDFLVWNMCKCLWDRALDVVLPLFQFIAKATWTAAGTDLLYGLQPGNTVLNTAWPSKTGCDQQHHCSVL